MYLIFKSLRTQIRRDFLNILGLLLVWRISLIFFLIFALQLIPLKDGLNFLGGTFRNYSISPEVFSWANFDGEHYLSIAYYGYRNNQQAFFPIYPILINLISTPFQSDFFSSLLSSTLVGILISNISIFIAIILLWELIRNDYSKKIAYLSVMSLIFFPTSFYFGSVYTESLFFLFCVGSFYFARKKKWFLASLLGGLASGTRVFGVLLFPALILEAWQQKTSLRKLAYQFIIPLGFSVYIIYLWTTVGDPFAFYNLQTLVGEQHQTGIVLLPQVYFRYLKMIFTLDFSNPIYFTIFIEFIVGILFFILPIYGYFKKLRYSYTFFALSSFILPTIQGSFSSMPRYVLVLFPSFIALGLLLHELPRLTKVIILVLSYLVLATAAMLFFRGYWIA